MFTGKINKLVRQRGFGFISATDGREIFFNQKDLVGIRFDELDEDLKVEFQVEKTPKGPCAFDIHVVKAVTI
ncbi:MAG: hypothetical protein A3G33_01180 [Omnitrophica bacterium RIFCSPLOWO2_12_FULL_44_17]|uniref:CSD domain-containing protein n=1 Tax=Candidatus Danuiimicrobium aquiferis TaxID=1801832 RepID=A0A1G1L0Y8_9BACT|nr:MAG: hypothetical protein A3B72_02495 [Omnitrophica bacterium RIFCSPHIGHO2_02_FULL_45_28]OGW91485.1 MAG: hypothetical protein A3E74_01975 [Omnitrophica bacterium RIFCSPHIGHO2_12_FULL_44_12]OGW98806.1 MAG: hypothetical protein A3G33_01180 [Omnitrophica bacterium RIFCSPLOWO2_12_FULL_44_17]OGX02512.1 MAG: hypothetical protein A3J12_00290 [Omnitrophica bacterium RIFCSPLOWO2_02_FULL_44_11]